MIIFDLEGVLADDSHRRHFIKQTTFCPDCTCNPEIYGADGSANCPVRDYVEFKPDYRAYYDACDKDEAINPTIGILLSLWIKEGEDIQIWSAHPEEMRKKITDWLIDNIFRDREHCKLILRPIGNTEPAHVLKERWLDEYLNQRLNGKLQIAQDKLGIDMPSFVQFTFDSDPDSIAMWRRRGVFCFDCRQI